MEVKIAQGTTIYSTVVPTVYTVDLRQKVGNYAGTKEKERSCKNIPGKKF